jgi:tRNA nucleotidyltransferase (CCA-adding enzyme)
LIPELERVCRNVLDRITPGHQRKARIHKLADELKKKVEAVAKKEGLAVEVSIEGSVAKGTWLSEKPDIDLFMRIPTCTPREALGSVCLRIAKAATQKHEQTERFAEHPYLECEINDVRVNIVPCYKVEKGNWLSSTDRTPFHTHFMKPLLNERLCGEVRLLKKFMEGIGVYGAEIRTGGFSGYLCELLALYFGSFAEVLRSAANWESREVIDCKGYYKGSEEQVREIFKNSLIVVDPVDRERNVAAAVREEKLWEFVAAARAFLESPDSIFFYPKEIEVLDTKEIARILVVRGSAFVFLIFGKVRAVPDILWGQLYKSQRSLRSLLQRFNFRVIRCSAWSDEEDLNLFVFELDNRLLSPTKKHLGPPVDRKSESEKFLDKHLEAERTVSGPRVEDNRWVVEIERECTDAVELLREKLREGGRGVGIAELISRTFVDSFEVLVNEEVLELYSSNERFAKFLSEYLKGRPRWMKRVF